MFRWPGQREHAHVRQPPRNRQPDAAGVGHQARVANQAREGDRAALRRHLEEGRVGHGDIEIDAGAVGGPALHPINAQLLAVSHITPDGLGRDGTDAYLRLLSPHDGSHGDVP